ncbi:twin-arginine translocation pathway signal protein [Veronia nyctiphanis]|uniref:twin-arginine translocation pathway signal protein n=1 Tax=Veronia nyctiphanis TaxID=1278244 RepID=UPI001F28DE7B|nr:twin-arginine translocation pathway signal protein [Veronia nyctiphanis]
MLSANPHNIQPWKVAFPAENQILLYVDSERLLPQTDPIHCQILIGQGTFIEVLVVAASHFGIRVDVNYFPQGEYDNQSLEAKPVASLTLVPDETIKADPLFQYLAIRQSTKTPYSSEILSTQQLVEVQKASEQADFSIQLVNKQDDHDTIANFLTEAMVVEEQKSARSLETIGMFRFNDQEMRKYRYGFGFPQNGVTGPKRWLAETLLVSRQKAENDWPRRGENNTQSGGEHSSFWFVDQRFE